MRYSAIAMKQPIAPYETQTALGKAFTYRLNQLGLSRRELVRRTGLSRQTLHNIEHSNLPLLPATLAAIDVALRWTEGTALALYDGTDVPKESSEPDRVEALRMRVVKRVILMTADELEKLVTEWADHDGET